MWAPADRHDSHGGVALLRAPRRLWPFLAHCFADQAYQGERVAASRRWRILPKAGANGVTQTAFCATLPFVRRRAGGLPVVTSRYGRTECLLLREGVAGIRERVMIRQ